MRHQKSGRKLGRNSSHRKAMLRNMVTSLFEYGHIRTTDHKAKELRRLVDRMVTLGKKDTLHARRLAARTIRTKDVLRHLFEVVAPGYMERHGGYTRTIKLGRRHGDNAEMSIIELMPPGAPELRQRGKAVKPSVAPTTAVPTTKETFDAEEAVEAAPAEEAVEAAPAEEAVEAAPAEEAVEAAPVEEAAAVEEEIKED